MIDNIDRMSDAALWKFAALAYVRGARTAPARGRRDAGLDVGRSHALSVARLGPAQARTTTCRQLQTMRYEMEQKLIKVSQGERSDKGNCDLMLKIIKAESEQRALSRSSTPRPRRGERRRLRALLLISRTTASASSLPKRRDHCNTRSSKDHNSGMMPDA